MKEDVFPDAEGWENVDPEEAAKWSVGSEFAHDPLAQSQTEGGPAAQTTIRIKLFSLFFFIIIAPNSVYKLIHL